MTTSEQNTTELHTYEGENRRAAPKEQGVDMLKAASTIIGGLVMALVLWMGQSVNKNTISLVELKVRLDQVFDAQKQNNVAQQILMSSVKEDVTGSISRLDGHLDSIWPRLRELKSRIQRLESVSPDERSRDPWNY